ncbi:MAG TPA: lysozyme inhibitor LprI family protein [Chthoniobacterales bacterium]
MKTLLSIAALAVALVIASGVSASGQKQTPPGAEELAAVERANATIDTVYAQLRNKLGPEERKSLQEAQRAWIKWRDAEADHLGVSLEIRWWHGFAEIHRLTLPDRSPLSGGVWYLPAIGLRGRFSRRHRTEFRMNSPNYLTTVIQMPG